MLISESDLIIRSATVKDGKILCQWWNDGKIMEHAGFPHGLDTTIEKVQLDIERYNDENQVLIIEYRNNPIGEMSYRTISDKVAEIGIKICDLSKHEKGLGTRLIRMLIEELFFSNDYTKIVLDTNLNNKRAQHVYEKIGFKKAKTNLNSWKNQLGEFQSSIDYELLKGDYFSEQK